VSNIFLEFVGGISIYAQSGTILNAALGSAVTI